MAPRGPLAHAHIHFYGFSETRMLMSHGAVPALQCHGGTEEAMASFRNTTSPCARDPRWILHRNSTFVAYCREARQMASDVYETGCSDGIRLSYAWKSFADSAKLDDQMEAYLLRQHHGEPQHAFTAAGRPARSPRTISIVSAGAHHFAQYADYPSKFSESVADNWAPPQRWMDDWLTQMHTLMARLRRLRSAGVCCVWKANHVGSRLMPGDVHHPSAEGGVHDYLNRVASAIATTAYQVPVIDLTEATVAETRGSLRQAANQPPGISTLDLYHGYNFSALWADLVAPRLAELCPVPHPTVY